MDYEFPTIEKRWQGYWAEHKTFAAEDDTSKPKFYALDMFPYPSGSGLHVGHPEGYTASDIIARYKRAKGFNVLHPMGWDAFGLPAEQYALESGNHPRDMNERNIARFKEQLQALGFAYDWDREVNTTDPSYYKWTQWIFLQLYKQGLAYIAEVPVNWCPALGTVLANEEVIDGRSERGGHPVVRRPMKQWMLKITAYAERLIDDLDSVDWPESIKEMQRNWIGKSIGAEVDFKLASGEGNIRVFTTRPDTLFGATYMVLAPEHPLVEVLTSPEQRAAVDAYVQKATLKTDLQRTDLAKEKTGVFTGGYAINPVNGEQVPVWVADYVLISYGTGAIMAVPGHDERDYEFAQTFEIPIRQVIDHPDAKLDEAAYSGDGTLMNSSFLDGLPAAEAKVKITEWLEDKGLGKRTVNYRLRDWLFSRQRFWGEPFPIVFTRDGEIHTIPEEQLPLTLPDVESYTSSGTGESPLAGITDWVETTDPETGEPARRETNTMPQWAGSCWYYLRYIDPHNDKALVDPKLEQYWMPVDLYVGGVEHAVLHLLYARFWHKVLFDVGVVSTKEPFQRLVNQGMILGYSYRYFEDPASGEKLSHKQVKAEGEGLQRKDTGAPVEPRFVPIAEVAWQGESPRHPEQPELVLEELTEKMSKSRGNVVNPDDVVREYGADSLRLYEMFMGPLEQVKPWNTKGVTGVHRFLARLWRRVIDGDSGAVKADIVDRAPNRDEQRLIHKAIRKVTEDTEAMRFNTAIAALMETLNAFYKADELPKSSLLTLLQLLAPYAPHICEELWERLGQPPSIAQQPWPEYDPALTEDDTVTIGVQVMGKVRGSIEVSPEASEDEAVAAARANEKVLAYLEGKEVRKVIYKAGRILNFVVKG